jgi:cytochrome oxidase Cu insertion factor (SCO1/SenC/PrrC family)
MGEWAGPVRRGLLWGVLLAALAVVGLVAARGWRGRVEAPPVLGELPAFELVDQEGRRVARETLLGTPWVADLVFTRCALACPRMTAAMARLDRRLAPEVGLVSVSIDPGYDTPEVLAAYAARYGASARWRFLTGEPAAVRALARDGFKLGVAEVEGEVDPGLALAHSDRFVLVDAGGRVRGYYDPFDAAALARLERDLVALRGETAVRP